MLMTWGQIVFKIMPLNVHEYEDTGSTEFAKKEISGVRPPREFVGEDDEEMTIRGIIYPHKIGGLTEIEAMNQVRKKGVPQQLTRGDGVSLGWWAMLKLHRVNKNLRADGIGQIITFEAMFFRADIPAGDEYFSQLYGMATASGG